MYILILIKTTIFKMSQTISIGVYIVTCSQEKLNEQDFLIGKTEIGDTIS